MDTSSWAKLGARAGWASGLQVGSSLPSVELPPDDRLSTARQPQTKGKPQEREGRWMSGCTAW
jgi:hypothetical protein